MYPLWDLPTRLFHWVLALAVLLSWVSQEEGYFDVHAFSGYTILVLVFFRVAWGFVGSQHSRFGDFLRGPRAVLHYLRGQGERSPGHNPAGGWSVLLMLLLVGLQAMTGLFNSDGLVYDGPFFHALDSGWTDFLGEIHAQAFWVLLGFIIVHIGAVLFYQLWRKQDLLTPMLTGGSEGTRAPQPLWKALLVTVLWVAALATALYFAPQPKLPYFL